MFWPLFVCMGGQNNSLYTEFKMKLHDAYMKLVRNVGESTHMYALILSGGTSSVL